MEHVQKPSHKPTPLRTLGSCPYSNRMNTLGDKGPGKLQTNKTSVNKKSEKVLNRPNLMQKQVVKQDKKFVDDNKKNHDNSNADEKNKDEIKIDMNFDHNPNLNADYKSCEGQHNTLENKYNSNNGDKLVDDSHTICLNQSNVRDKEVNHPLNTIPNEIKGLNHEDPAENTIVPTHESNVGDIDDNLPPTAILLTTKGGSKVYVVGTVHFSAESQKDVANVIRAVHPDYVVLELCSSRAYMLQWDEERILKEAQQLNFSGMRQVIQSTGFIQGGLYLLLLSMTIQITKQLGIAPGGEFRTAYREAAELPNCVIWFGDRPIPITLQRMLASLSLWQIIKLTFVVLFTDEKISKEDVEKCKDRDILERMILGFSRELPEFARVMVDERDAYLAYNLQLAAQKSEPNKVVGVVGIGHLAGIKKYWGEININDIYNITAIPPPKRSTKIIKFTLKFTAVGLVLYGVHMIASKSSLYSNLFSDQNYWSMSNIMFDIWDSPVIQT